MKTAVLFLFLTLPQIHAEETEAPAAPEKPVVEQIDATRYRIGEVTLDKKTREIRFPAVINLREGLLEFLIVHSNGKVHESLFASEVSPTHLNVAFKLLRYEASKELYRIPKEPGVLTAEFYDEPAKVKDASRIAVLVEYEKDGETQSVPAYEWIRHETTAQAMQPTAWIYGGGEFYENQFVPEQTGDIAAIFITNGALINYPGKDNFNDEVWSSFNERVPAEGTKVTLVFAPYVEP
ncbi:MAG: YdjY domain-containing protein [Luteolibacter sp.]